MRLLRWLPKLRDQKLKLRSVELLRFQTPDNLHCSGRFSGVVGEEAWPLEEVIESENTEGRPGTSAGAAVLMAGERGATDGRTRARHARGGD